MGSITDAAAKAARRKAALRKMEPNLPPKLTYRLGVIVMVMAAVFLSMTAYGRITRDDVPDPGRQVAAGTQSIQPDAAPEPVGRLPLEDVPCPIDDKRVSDHHPDLQKVAVGLADMALQKWELLAEQNRAPATGRAYMCISEEAASIAVVFELPAGEPEAVLTIGVVRTDTGWDAVPDTLEGSMLEAARELSAGLEGESSQPG